MAGFGALLGVSGVLWAALLAAGVGGILAVGALAWRALRRMLGMAPAAVSADTEHAGGESAPAARDKESIPYAPAITLGVWLSLVPKG
jgi:Flp pilus assembly protein protease CpaA